MKKPKKIKKPSLKAIKGRLPSSKRLRKLTGQPAEPAVPAGVPRITNESIAEHREEVLGSARKYIYPLRHPKHRIVKISIILFIVAVVVFFAGCLVSLYKLQTTSSFMYSVTRILPFPVAKAGSYFVSYDSYLFELRHFMHYYESQQGSNFSTDDGKRQLERFKKQSMDAAVNQAYVKQLAKKHGVSVSQAEVNQQIALVRQQNRLGASDEVFRNVLREFWDWSVDDFKRELRYELLEQKVINKLDTETHQRAQSVLNQLQAGADFAQLAAQYSDDAATKDNGGNYGFAVDQNSRDVSPQAVEALFKLRKKSDLSGIINSGYYLEIDKLVEDNTGTGKLQAAHITFNFKDVNTYLAPIKKQQPTTYYLHL